MGGAALVLGAVVGLRSGPSQRTIGLVMAFGAGVLISALSFELTAESFERGGSSAVAGGLAAGGLSFFGAKDRKRSGGEQEGGSAGAIVVGALMDGVPPQRGGARAARQNVAMPAGRAVGKVRLTHMTHCTCGCGAIPGGAHSRERWRIASSRSG